MNPLTLAEAMKCLRSKPATNGIAQLNLISHCGLHQFRIFLEAYFSLYQSPVTMLEEIYGGLFKKLHEPPLSPCLAHLIILDSDTLLAGRSLRSHPNDNSDKAFQDAIVQLKSTLRSFAAQTQDPVFILPLRVDAAYFEHSVPSVVSVPDRRFTHCLEMLSELQLENPQIQCLKVTPSEIDQKRFLETGEPLHSHAASTAALAAVRGILTQIRGQSPDQELKKLLITDLDNTFWGGILGEVGWEAITCDETALGKGHWLYQHFLNQLASEGVILAIASKNNAETVFECFSKRQIPCPLKNFAMTEIHWNPKSTSVTRILETLNLLPSSVVIIDDSPAELDEITQAIPDVTTLCFPSSLSEMPDFLKSLRGHFLRARPATGVESRLKSYQSAARIAVTRETNSDGYENYLKSLEMELTIERIRPEQKERVFELLNKTNQFNLTGQRYHLSEFEMILRNAHVYAISLKDRLTDFGIIGAAIVNQNTLEQFVLSCRVFSRHIEDASIKFFRERGVTEIPFRPTPKNQLVHDFLNLPKVRPYFGILTVG